MTAPIRPGCEPFSFVGGTGGVLVLHGFTGNPFSMRPLAQRCAQAGYSVELPLLPGHGTEVADILTTRWSDWSGVALDAFDELATRCERVAVVGLSMGGALTAMVAEQRASVAGCVFINPMLQSPGAEIEEGLAALLDAGLETLDKATEDIKKTDESELAYESWPLAALASVFEGIGPVKAELSRITAPCLLLSSRQDDTVPPENGTLLVEHVTGPLERIWLEDSFHVATLDNDRELVETSTIEFLVRVLS
jgi:carboxylesterase